MGIIKLPDKSIQYFKNHTDEIFESGKLAEGKWNIKLSEYVKNLTKAKRAIPTNSNGSGLVAIMSLYQHYHHRSKVMIQSNTMYGVKVMVVASGCKLIDYIKCRKDTLMPSIDDVKNAIIKLSDKEKSSLIILLSHIGGIINPDIVKISQLCKTENIILLEDCAHSFGATLNNMPSGLFGDAGVYSFYATKAIPAGEGGVVVTNNEELGAMISDYAIYDRFKQKLQLGNNIRISEIQALLTYSVISQWNTILKDKTTIAEEYIKICTERGIKFISQNRNNQKGNYYKFILYTLNSPVSDELPSLQTATSAVYDYSIGVPNQVAGYHICLPIWYGQEHAVTEKVKTELNKVSKL